MSAFTYPARFTAGGDGRVLVEFVDLPRVSTDGKDDHEAMEEAMDALGSDLSIRLSRREEIPAPSGAKRGQRLVPVPLWLAPPVLMTWRFVCSCGCHRTSNCRQSGFAAHQAGARARLGQIAARRCSMRPLQSTSGK